MPDRLAIIARLGVVLLLVGILALSWLRHRKLVHTYIQVTPAEGQRLKKWLRGLEFSGLGSAIAVGWVIGMSVHTAIPRWLQAIPGAITIIGLIWKGVTHAFAEGKIKPRLGASNVVLAVSAGIFAAVLYWEPQMRTMLTNLADHPGGSSAGGGRDAGH